MKNSIKLFALLFLSITFFASCNKDDEEVLPDYVGTWIIEGVSVPDQMATLKSTEITDGDLSNMFGSGNATLVLTKNTFDMVLNMVVFGFTMPVGGMSGDFVVNGHTFKQTTKNVRMLTDFENGTMTSYAPGTPEFDSFLNGRPAEVDGEYSVSGNKLTLNFDYNGDGLYEGDEIMIFTKK